MKARTVLIACISLLLIFTALGTPGGIAETETSDSPVESSADITRGEIIAREASIFIGTALSPILGLVTMGWIEFIAAKKGGVAVPWDASLWFVIPMTVLWLLIVLKETVGQLLVFIVKIFDGIDFFLHKLIVFVALASRLPRLLEVILGPGGVEAPPADALIPALSSIATALAPAASVAAAHAVLSVVLGFICLMVFLVVWLAASTVETACLISPVPLVATILRIGRFLVIGGLALAVVINPYLGAAYAFFVVLISYFVSGWSFRLSIYGAVIGFDTLTMKSRRTDPESEEALRAFSTSRVKGVPGKSYGRLGASAGGLTFSYRPWLVLARRDVVLPQDTSGWRVAKGSLNPLVVRPGKKEGGFDEMFDLAPRYKNHEESVAKKLSLNPEVPDLTLGKKISGAFGWLKSQFSRRKAVEDES
ncbi:MAG: hypothetical protein JW885_06010 [Deltaproteobacteria bacterium]|nr:hypothetical protein [Candidatus Zymogenaceae bacterium]